MSFCIKPAPLTEAGLPSGTFTTADEALAIGREVFTIPGAITTLSSRDSNQLIRQSAAVIIDDEGFLDELSRLFTLTNCATDILANTKTCQPDPISNPLIAAIAVHPHARPTPSYRERTLRNPKPYHLAF